MIRQFVNVACCVALWGLMSLSADGMFGKQSKSSAPTAQDDQNSERNAEIALKEVRRKTQKIKKQCEALQILYGSIKRNEEQLKNALTFNGLAVYLPIDNYDQSQLLYKSSKVLTTIDHLEQLVSSYLASLSKVSKLGNPDLPKNLQDQLDSLKRIEEEVAEYKKTAEEFLHKGTDEEEEEEEAEESADEESAKKE